MTSSYRRMRRLAVFFAVTTVIALPAVAWPSGARVDVRAGDRDVSAPTWKGPAAPATSQWSDVPDAYWAKTAIDYVASTHTWMQDFGATAFQPTAFETRELFARAAVEAFAPDEATDPNITFPDLPLDDPFYPYANVAVKLQWLSRGPAGGFNPNGIITPIGVHRALVRALGLIDVATGINAIHTPFGYHFVHSSYLGTTMVGMLIGLRYNHSTESLDVGPTDKLSRAEVAWSLYRAATMPSWEPTTLAPYKTITVVAPTAAKRAVVEFGLKYVGYPYVYAGEWYTASPPNYCCGAQPRGGFDCSGLMWWVVKSPQNGYDPTVVRPYVGWPLPERASYQMAPAAPVHLTYSQLRSGDLMFYDGSGNGVVDHVDLYLGNGWSLDSSSSIGGVTIVRVGSGWYHDHFVWGRRIMGPQPSPSPSPTATSPSPTTGPA